MTTNDKAESMSVEELIERSNRLGSDPRNTNYAGGNTSAAVPLAEVLPPA